MIDYSILRIDQENYALFDDMVFFRVNNRERTPGERAAPRDFSTNCAALANKNLRVYAAQADGRLVGWVSAVFVPKIGHPAYGGKGHLLIDELWVTPAFRQHGIASALIAKAEDAAREMNAVGLRLYVSGDNPGAFALYTKCGYRDRGSNAHFMDKEWADPTDA